MDAANVDLKCFTEDFYHKLCGAHLASVLETLRLPQARDQGVAGTHHAADPGPERLRARDRGDDAVGRGKPRAGRAVALHGLPPGLEDARHPAPPRAAPWLRAHAIARRNGVRYAYTGNVHDEAHGATYCHGCDTRLIGRDWYRITDWNLGPGGTCRTCGTACAGLFDADPGTWGAKRQPVRLLDYHVVSSPVVRLQPACRRWSGFNRTCGSKSAMTCGPTCRTSPASPAASRLGTLAATVNGARAAPGKEHPA